MKNHAFLFFFTCISTISFSQSLVHAWTHTWGNADFAVAPDLAVDEDANVYVAGSFKGTIDFDPGNGITAFTSWDGGLASDTYIAKYNSSGQFLWIRHLVATRQHFASKIVYDPDGYIYITGYFNGSCDFDPGPNVFNLTSGLFKDDMYILKLDLDGNFVWAISTQGSGNKYVGCISLDDQGNILAGGIFTGTVDFDPSPAVQSYTSTSEVNDAFFVKYSHAGTLTWAKAIFGNNRVGVRGVDVDETGNVYYAGFFDDLRDFDPGINSVLLQAHGPSDAWVMKLNTFGNFLWMKRLGNDGENLATDIAVSNSNEIFVTGIFSGDIDFNQGNPIDILIANNTDPFVWKMNYNGEYKWAGQFAGSSFDHANAITIDGNGDIYISGYFADTVDFDPGPGTHYLISTGENNEDAFLAKLHPDGKFVWAHQAGGLDDDAAGAVQLDPHNHIYATGEFQGTAGFFLGDTNEDSIVSRGSIDVFLTRWLQCARSHAEWNVTSCDTSYVSPSGKYIWTASGVYQDTIENRAGCDSVLTINLELLVLNPQVDFLPEGDGFVAVEENASYQWAECLKGFLEPVIGATHQTFIPGHTGSYAVILQLKECTTISDCYFIDLMQCEESHAEWNITTCDDSYVSPSENYIWTQSGVYQDTIANLAGCDSVLTINLELREESHAELNVTTCDTSYLSPSGKYIWTQSGVYQDTIVNLAGCDSVLTLSLELVVLNPQVDYLVTGDGFFAVEDNASYQWVECLSEIEPVSGATQQTFIPAHTGSYAVILEQGECTTLSDCYFIMITAVEEAGLFGNAILYPNPTKNGFSIQLPSRFDEVQVELHTVTGQEVYKEKFLNSDLLRFENSLEPGIYFVHVKANHTGKVFKLIVE